MAADDDIIQATSGNLVGAVAAPNSGIQMDSVAAPYQIVSKRDLIDASAGSRRKTPEEIGDANHFACSVDLDR